MTLRVHVGGAVFHSAPPLGMAATFEGCTIGPAGLVGWFDRPAGRGGGTALAGRHGESDERLWLGGRSVTISGHVVADRDEVDAACDRLSALGADGGQLQIVVEKDGKSTWAMCRVVSVQIDRETLGSRPAFMVVVRCANPRRFGESMQSPPTGSLVPRLLENRGNFRAAPRFQVRGPQPSGYRIWGEGLPDPFHVTAALPAGSLDVVSFEAGTVVRNGSLLLGGVLTPVIWTVPGPGSRLFEAALSGSGLIVGEVTDTYV